jgi:hypothetical protein
MRTRDFPLTPSQRYIAGLRYAVPDGPGGWFVPPSSLNDEFRNSLFSAAFVVDRQTTGAGMVICKMTIPAPILMERALDAGLKAGSTGTTPTLKLL